LENNTIEQISELQRLWDLEKQLICLLEDFDRNKAVSYSKKNKFSEDGFSSSALSGAQKPHVSQIILSSNDLSYSGGRNESSARFTGGSMSERIRHLEQMLGETPSNKEQKKFLTFDEKSVELEQIERILGCTPNRQKTPNNQKETSGQPEPLTAELEQKIHRLSIEILESRKKAGLNAPVCDKTTARDIDIALGGNGTFFENGVAVIIPNTPLGKTCPHQIKEGQYPTVLRCVVCPANYGDSAERLEMWFSFIKKRQEDNKQQKKKKEQS